MAGEDHPIDPRRDLQVPRDPLRRHQGRHRDRQDGDLGLEPGARGQVVEHLPEGELGQAAGDEQDAAVVAARRRRGVPSSSSSAPYCRGPDLGRSTTSRPSAAGLSPELESLPVFPPFFGSFRAGRNPAIRLARAARNWVRFGGAGGLDWVRFRRRACPKWVRFVRLAGPRWVCSRPELRRGGFVCAARSAAESPQFTQFWVRLCRAEARMPWQLTSPDRGIEDSDQPEARARAFLPDSFGGQFPRLRFGLHKRRPSIGAKGRSGFVSYWRRHAVGSFCAEGKGPQSRCQRSLRRQYSTLL